MTSHKFWYFQSPIFLLSRINDGFISIFIRNPTTVVAASPLFCKLWWLNQLRLKFWLKWWLNWHLIDILIWIHSWNRHHHDEIDYIVYSLIEKFVRECKRSKIYWIQLKLIKKVKFNQKSWLILSFLIFFNWIWIYF